MKRTIGVITADGRAGRKYGEQLREALGEEVQIDLYSTKEGSFHHIKPAELYLISRGAICFDSGQSLSIPLGVPVLDICADFTKESVCRLQEIPEGSTVLFVNATEFLARECITRLQQLEVSHIRFLPYYPGAPLDFSPSIIAVTAGEPEMVPEGVAGIVDLGGRKLTPQMVMEAALALDMREVLESGRLALYAEDFDTGSYSHLHASLKKSIYMEDCFDIFVESLDEGVIGINQEGMIFSFNQKAGEILDCGCQEMVGTAVGETLPFLPFGKCKATCFPIENEVLKLDSGYVSYSVRPILRKGKFGGIFATLQRFTESERKQQEVRMQVLNKGRAAKYHFQNIVGESPVLQKTKALAQRMARTDFTILICGDSGTGKELFASAIHNASPRAQYPYVAINCAAMPENLLESELFGYEEGAFTGAKKGGRLGLFEFAHGGTLFLDEIENMSQALQAKLLRVLQEREVMRLGGNQTIHVDVRVIAATNESLEKAVHEGRFRKDLYYRISTLPVQLPTLNERREDIPLLFDYFKARYGKDLQLSPDAREALMTHDWDGNVRELQNYIEFFICLEKDVIEKEDLPMQMTGRTVLSPEAAQVQRDERAEAEAVLSEIGGRKDEQYRFVLSVLFAGYVRRSNVGRSAIVKRAAEQDLFLTEQEVRTILNRLQERGLLVVSRGRSGSRLTEAGKQLCTQLSL